MRTLTLLNRGSYVHLEQDELAQLVPLGLTTRRLENGSLSRFVQLDTENRAILEEAGYDFRVPVR